MSMLCSVYRLPASHIVALQERPELVAELLDDPLPPPQPGLWARLLRKKPITNPAPARTVAPLEAQDRFELDATWHILHFVFTGLPDGGTGPHSFVAQGGQPVGRDLGYGAPRLFDQAATHSIAEFLDSYTRMQLAAAYQPDAIAAAEIYWRASSQPGEVEAQVNDLWQCIQDLREFVSHAAHGGSGLLVDIY